PLLQEHLVQEAAHFPGGLALEELLRQGPDQRLQLQILLKQVCDVAVVAQDPQLLPKEAGMGNAAFGRAGPSEVQRASPPAGHIPIIAQAGAGRQSRTGGAGCGTMALGSEFFLLPAISARAGHQSVTADWRFAKERRAPWRPSIPLAAGQPWTRPAARRSSTGWTAWNAQAWPTCPACPSPCGCFWRVCCATVTGFG